MTSRFDYYAILGVDETATAAEIREAFAALRQAIPPAERDPAVNPEYERLLQAFEVLNDPQRRKTYDSLLVETSPLSLNVDVKMSQTQIELSENVQTIYLLMEVHPPVRKDRQQLPLNLCLVVDRSTSMQGERLRFVKTAVRLVVERLSERDRLSVVSFSDRAEIVVPAASVTEHEMVMGKVRGIMPSGGTEIYQGLQAGVSELQKAELAHYTNHLILLTDGHTYGDDEQCLQLATAMAPRGIGFSAFGIGAEWNDRFLDQLVAPSGGESGYIETPEQIIEFLRKKIKGLGNIYAQNMRLKHDFPRSITVKQGFKLLPFAQPLSLDGADVQLGNLEGRHPITLLLVLLVAPQPIETRINVPLVLTAEIPSNRMQERMIKQQVQLYVVSDAAKAPPPKEIIEAVRRLNLYQMNEKVQEAVDAGNLDAATRRMRHLTTRLLEAGEAQLAQQAHAEAERLSEMGTLSLEGRKKLKYGTRALMDQTTRFSSAHD